SLFGSSGLASGGCGSRAGFRGRAVTPARPCRRARRRAGPMPQRPRPALPRRAWTSCPLLLLAAARAAGRSPLGAAWAAAAPWPRSWPASAAPACGGGPPPSARRGAAAGPSAAPRGPRSPRRAGGLGGSGGAELVEAAGGPPLSSAGLRERRGLRLPLPERVALRRRRCGGAPAAPEVVVEASFQAWGRAARPCGSAWARAASWSCWRRSAEAAAAGRPPAAGRIRWPSVQSPAAVPRTSGAPAASKSTARCPGAVLATGGARPSGLAGVEVEPAVAAPGLARRPPRHDAARRGARGRPGRRGPEEPAPAVLRRRPGAVAYNGVGGVSLEGYPRDYDGVNVSFTVWSCAGATGSCSVLEDAEDPGALVCEFGPQVILLAWRSVHVPK
ncbi:unnamed protein product, partial [Prorocentrum cordatum]